jgi:hypothetical protein
MSIWNTITGLLLGDSGDKTVNISEITGKDMVQMEAETHGRIDTYLTESFTDTPPYEPPPSPI